jgi:hypothetical protein
MSASETVYRISKTEYENPAQNNTIIMMAVDVFKHSGSVTVAQDEEKDAYFKQHSQLIQMSAKFYKFLFYLQHNNRT